MRPSSGPDFGLKIYDIESIDKFFVIPSLCYDSMIPVCPIGGIAKKDKIDRPLQVPKCDTHPNYTSVLRITDL